MKILRTIIRWTVFLGFVACAAIGIYYYTQPKPISVDVANVKTGRLVVTVDEDGMTRIKERYIVSAPLSGRLSRARLKPGDWVLEIVDRRRCLTSFSRLDSSLSSAIATADIEATAMIAKANLDHW